MLSQGLANNSVCQSPAVQMCRYTHGGQGSNSGVVPQDGCPYFETRPPTGIWCLPDWAMLASLGAQGTSCLYLPPSVEITSLYHCLTSPVSIRDQTQILCFHKYCLLSRSSGSLQSIHCDWERCLFRAQQSACQDVVASHFPDDLRYVVPGSLEWLAS